MTEEKSERKEPAKKGLHGWKAATAIFGCGTLAAFGVFGVIVGVLSLIISTASSGISGASDQQVPIPIQTGKPREELAPGGLDFCNDYFHHITDIDVDDLISAEHKDDADSPGYGQDDLRKASGECSFTVHPQFGSTELWHFDFEYEAFVSDPSRNEVGLASDLFDLEVEEAEVGFNEVESREQLEWADSVNAIYGTGVNGASKYVAVAQTRSVVFKIVFVGDSGSVGVGEVPKFDFERQADALGGRLHKMFFDAVPE